MHSLLLSANGTRSNRNGRRSGGLEAEEFSIGFILLDDDDKISVSEEFGVHKAAAAVVVCPPLKMATEETKIN